MFWHENVRSELKKLPNDIGDDLQMIALCDKYGWTYEQLMNQPKEWIDKLVGFLNIQAEKTDGR